MNLYHIVVIRFSIRAKDKRYKQAYGSEENRESWFASRCDLFRATIHASLTRQSTAPLKVFVLFDEGDTELYKKYLNLSEGFYHPLFSKGDSGRQEVINYLKASGLANVALHRIDSDDLVSDVYFEKVGEAIRCAFRKGVNFKYVISAVGWKTNGVFLRKAFFNYSPFLAVFYREYNGEDVYAIRHGQVLRHPHIISSDSHWMQFIHGGNLANGFPADRWWHLFSIKYLSPKLFEWRTNLAVYSMFRQKFYSRLIRIDAGQSNFWPDKFVNIILNKN